jgi:hypothetical protein
MNLRGCRRWATAIDLGLDKVPVEVRTYNSELEEWEDILSHNIARDKTFTQKMKEAELRKEIVAEEAKKRQVNAGKQYGEKHPKSQELSPISDKPLRTDDTVGKQVGVGGRDTYRKAEKIWEKAKTDAKIKEMVGKLDAGELTINRVYNEIIREELPAIVAVDPPTGKYRCLVIDLLLKQ